MNIEKNIAKDEKRGYNDVNKGTQSNIKNTPKDDVIFKLLFGKTHNEHLLKDFLEALLEINITELKVDNPTVLLPEKFNEKMGTLDILATLDDGTKVNIEMQNKKHLGIQARVIFYLDKIYLNSVIKGTPYDQIPKVIAALILNENEFDNIESYHSVWHWTYDKDLSIKFDCQEIHIVELPKFRNAVPNLNNRLEQWLVFLDHENKELINMATEKNKEIKEAQEELDKILADEQTQYMQYLMEKGEMERAIQNAYYKAEGKQEGLAEGEAKGRASGLAEGEAKGRAEGRASGLAEGELKSKLEIAKNLLKVGMSIEDISNATGLSIDEIENLKK